MPTTPTTEGIRGMAGPKSGRQAKALLPANTESDDAKPDSAGTAPPQSSLSSSSSAAAAASSRGSNARAVSDAQLELMILQMTAARGSAKTCCPSEIPRRLLGERGAWRELMGRTRAVAVRLAKEGRVTITQRGQGLCVGDVGKIRGPIRLRAVVAGTEGGAGKSKNAKKGDVGSMEAKR